MHAAPDLVVLARLTAAIRYEEIMFHGYSARFRGECRELPFPSSRSRRMVCDTGVQLESRGGRLVLPAPDPAEPQPRAEPGQRRHYHASVLLGIVGIGIILLVIAAYAVPLFPAPSLPAGNITPHVTAAPAATVSTALTTVTPIATVISPASTTTVLPRPDPTVTASANQTGAVSRSYDYVLRGNPGSITLTLYTGIYDQQRAGMKPATCLRYSSDPSPCTQEEIRQYYLRYLNESSQEQGLDELVSRIRSKSSNPDDQARIAISLVQNIPYDFGKLDALNPNMSYPYGVLYRQKGVCSEKSLLLAYLLRELGYGVGLFEFRAENHMALGIRSPAAYSYRNSSYAFVETTAPSIVTDADGDYIGVGKLTSIPGIMPISPGRSFVSVGEEYQDALQFNQLIGMGSVLDQAHYFQWTALVQKYGIKVTPSSDLVSSSPSSSQSPVATCDINQGNYCAAGANCCQKDNLCYSPCSRGVWEPRDCVCLV